MVLDLVAARILKLAYGYASDQLFAPGGQPAAVPSCVFEFRTSMPAYRPVAANVRLSAMRELVEEVRRNGLLGSGRGDPDRYVSKMRQSGTRLGNCLTREHAAVSLLF